MKIAGQIIHDSSQIEDEIVSFFGALFNGHHDRDLRNTGSAFVPDNSGLDDILQDLSKMDLIDSEVLETDIDIEELDIVVKECASNKSPGLDGLVYEFYKTVWPIIRKTFTMVLQCQLDRMSIE